MASRRDVLSLDLPQNRRNRRKWTPMDGEIRRNPATIALAKFFCLNHRGFDRVPAGCRARDRVGPKGGRRWSAIAHFLDIFSYFQPRRCGFPFSNVAHTDRQTKK